MKTMNPNCTKSAGSYGEPQVAINKHKDIEIINQKILNAMLREENNELKLKLIQKDDELIAMEHMLINRGTSNV